TQIARVSQPVALEGTQVIRISQLGAKLLEELPVPLRPFRSDGSLEVAAQVRGHDVVVEQRVVDVEQPRVRGHVVRAVRMIRRRHRFVVAPEGTYAPGPE